MCPCLCSRVCHAYEGAREGQKRGQIALELELQAIASQLMWGFGNRPLVPWKSSKLSLTAGAPLKSPGPRTTF